MPETKPNKIADNSAESTARTVHDESIQADREQLQRFTDKLIAAMPHFESAMGSPVDHAEACLNALIRERSQEMTLADAIDAFPSLRGLRVGTVSTPGRTLRFEFEGRQFIEYAAKSGPMEQALAMLLVELSEGHENPIAGCMARAYCIAQVSARACQPHRDALARVISAFIRQGGQFAA